MKMRPLVNRFMSFLHVHVYMGIYVCLDMLLTVLGSIIVYAHPTPLPCLLTF